MVMVDSYDTVDSTRQDVRNDLRIRDGRRAGCVMSCRDGYERLATYG